MCAETVLRSQSNAPAFASIPEAERSDTNDGQSAWIDYQKRTRSYQSRDHEAIPFDQSDDTIMKCVRPEGITSVKVKDVHNRDQ